MMTCYIAIKNMQYRRASYIPELQQFSLGSCVAKLGWIDTQTRVKYRQFRRCANKINNKTNKNKNVTLP